MRDIKERVRDKNPKIRNPAARLPKEMVRSAILEAKEKPRELREKSSGQSDSPTQYGTEKIESVQYRAASAAGRTIGKTTYQGGKKLAGVTYRKIKERKSRQEEAKAAEEAMEQGAESGKKLIKLKPEQAALAKENGKRQVKAAPRVVKVSGLSQEKIKTQASMQKQQVEKSLQAMQKARVVQMARKSAQTSAESGKAVFQVTGKGSKLSVQGITAAIQKGVVALEKMGKWIAAGGGAFLLVFILIVGIIAGATVVITCNIAGGYHSLLKAFRYAAFQVASVITTTGFVTADFNKWPELSKCVLLLVMVIGASAGSTGGGIKVSRLLILVKSIRRELKTMIHPKAVNIVKVNGKKVKEETMRGVYIYFIAYILILIVSVLLISINNFDFTTSFTGVLTTLNNVGPGLNLVGPVENFAKFSDFSKIVFCVDMLIGRLEIFPFLMLFSPSLWSRKF